MRVDLKSLLLGIGLILALFVVIGQTTKSSEPIGRYQVIMPHTTGAAPTFLIDTKTGSTRSLEIEPVFYWSPPVPTIEQALRDSTYRSIFLHYYEERDKKK